jgi:hypothetical protein
MNGSTPEEMPGLGRKIEKPVTAPVDPKWRSVPGNPGYQMTTDGKSIRPSAP